MQEVSEVKQSVTKITRKKRRPDPITFDITPDLESSTPSTASLEEAVLGVELFQANLDPILLVEPETDLIKMANPACHRLFGYAPGQLVGRSYYDLLQPEARVVYHRQKKLVLGGQPTESRILARHQSGQAIFTRVSARPLSYQDKTELILTVQQTLVEENGKKLRLNPGPGSRASFVAKAASFKKKEQSLYFEELAPLIKVILYQLRLKINYSSAATLAFEDYNFTLADYEFNEAQPPQNKWLHLALALTELVERPLLKAKPVILSDLERQPELGQELSEYSNMFPGLRVEELRGSWLAVPLMVENQLLGVLSLHSEQPGYFGAEHLKTILPLVQKALLTRIRLYRRVQERILGKERERLARDLHDSVNQALYGIQLMANSALSLLEQGQTDQVADFLKKISAEANDGTVAMRTLLLELRPEFLQTEGLVAALQKQVEALKAYRKLSIEARLEEEPSIALEQKEALYFIGREALHNAAKHSKATRVNLGLYRQATNLVLEIEDNGKGFDSEASFMGHVGLHNMRERAALIGATLDITSQAGQGTLIMLCLPLSPSEIGARAAS